MVASRTLSQWLLNFTLDSEDSFHWYKQKKWFHFLTEAWTDIYYEGGIYINSNLNPLTKFTSSSKNTKFKDILPWNISQMITKTIEITTKIAISYAMKQGIPFWIWWKVNENWDNSFPKKAITEQILASKETNKSKRAGLWKSQLGIQVGTMTISER